MGATAESMLLVALGTGHQNRAYSYYETRNWGPINWINPAHGAPIISILMHGQSHAAEHQLELLLNGGPQTNYYRLDAELDGVNDEMDDATDENLAALDRFAKRLIGQEIDAHIEALAESWLEAGLHRGTDRPGPDCFAQEVELFIGDVLLRRAERAAPCVKEALREILVLERDSVYGEVRTRVEAHLRRPALP
jgi:hypothetical protein